ncbi:MAG: hypothetical protein Q4F35_08280 [Akkermansia sp.]|nr:hypothetical protein [Akkermansia sp.]
MTLRNILLIISLGCSAGLASDNINDGNPADSRPYPFPEGEHTPRDIIYFHPQLPDKDHAATTFGGQISAFSGFLPQKVSGDIYTFNSNIYHLVRDKNPNPDRSYVSHITLGGNTVLNEHNISIHNESRQPARVNVLTAFGSGTLLNFSGDVLADITKAGLGAKLYCSGATFSNGLKDISNNLELVKGGTIVNDIKYEGGRVTPKVAPAVIGTLILTNTPLGDEDDDTPHYEPLTILGDITLSCEIAPRSLAFYAEWKKQQETQKLQELYRLPSDGTPVIICNSTNVHFPGLLRAYALKKKHGKDFTPSEYFLDITADDLATSSIKAGFNACLNKDGRVYICYVEKGGGSHEELPEAKVVKEIEKFKSTVPVYRIVDQGQIDFTEEKSDEISLDNITAGNTQYGAGSIKMRSNQLITINGHKTIRHNILGTGEMILQGKPKEPINVAFERLLNPKIDKKQGCYELKTISVNYATAYVGPGNLVGRRSGSGGKILLNNRSALLNYGAITSNIWADRECRITNSHYAATRIFKHFKGNKKIHVTEQTYPGTISGNVILYDGAEFLNYGTVRGNIEIGANCVMYGNGNCQGKVTVLNGGVLYCDASLIPDRTRKPDFQRDLDISYSETRHAENTINTLVIQKDGALGFRVCGYLETHNSTTFLIDENISTLKITNRLIAPKNLNVRVDIDGQILNCFGDSFRIPLLTVQNKKKLPKIKQTKLTIGCGSELVEDTKLQWNELTGELFLIGRISKNVRETMAEQKKKK